MANGLVYLGAADGTISAIPETGGAPVWSTNVGAPIVAPDEQALWQVIDYLREENRTVGVLIPEGTPVREAPGSGLGPKSIH